MKDYSFKLEEKNLKKKQIIKEKISKRLVWSIILVLFLIIIDQSIKIYVLKNHLDDKMLIKNTLGIDYVENTGGVFGIAQGSTITFVVTNVIVLGLIVRFIYLQQNEIDIKTLIMLLLIFAGGLSNFIDRITLGFIVDYINILPRINFPRFNFADVYIVAGWTAFIATVAIRTIRDLIKMKKNDKEEERQ